MTSYIDYILLSKSSLFLEFLRLLRNLLHPSYSPGRRSDLCPGYPNDTPISTRRPGQGAAAECFASICPQNTETPRGLEQTCGDVIRWKGNVPDNNSWGCNCYFPGSSANPCAHPPSSLSHAQCDRMFTAYLEHLRSRKAKDINKEQHGRT